MSNAIEKLVLHSPYFVRTLGANYKSWRLNRLRRGGDWDSYLARLDFHQYFELSPDEIQDKQNRRLANLIKETVEHVPYYREQAAHLPHVSSVEDLASFPTLSKSQAREAGEKLTNEVLQNKERFYTGHTSGTTGTPFEFKLPYESLHTRYALRDNFYKYHGCDFRERNLRLGGRLFVPVSQRKPPFWIVDRVTNQLMFSVYHMSDTTISSYLDAIKKYNPIFVTGYPSAVYTLARFCRLHDFDYRPRAVITDSETLLDYQREEIKKAWACEAYDYYGMETGWLAGRCKHGKYHLSPMTSIVEILDENGAAQAPGEIGEIVATDLTNPLMPLIRYRTGDAGVWSTQPCDCGWQTPTLDRIEGRLDDIVVLPNGRRVGRLDHVFKSASSIRECQIIQETFSDFTFLLVPDIGYTSEIEQGILDEAYARLGADISIDIKIVDAIERTSRGKFRSVISKVNPTQPHN